MASLSTVDWVFLAKGDAQVGDVVSADAGGMPIYRVVAVAEDEAWLQDGLESRFPTKSLSRFCWKASNLAT